MASLITLTTMAALKQLVINGASREELIAVIENIETSMRKHMKEKNTKANAKVKKMCDWYKLHISE